jgi:hypothetical protein
MPENLRALAEDQTLKFNRHQYQGKQVPILTAAFWSKGEHLDAAFPWREVLKNGAHIIKTELMENIEEALNEWQDAYQMSTDQIRFVRSLFERRTTETQKLIELPTSDVLFLEANSKNQQAMEESRRAFLAIGIWIP